MHVGMLMTDGHVDVGYCTLLWTVRGLVVIFKVYEVYDLWHMKRHG